MSWIRRYALETRLISDFAQRAVKLGAAVCAGARAGARALVLVVALLALGFPVAARANSLRLFARIQAETRTSLVPKAKNFKMCFKVDASGNPVLSLCAEEQTPSTAPMGSERRRVPASKN